MGLYVPSDVSNSLSGQLFPNKWHIVEGVLQPSLLIEPDRSVTKPNKAIKVKTQNHKKYEIDKQSYLSSIKVGSGPSNFSSVLILNV
jgi:hypothetical protein